MQGVWKGIAAIGVALACAFCIAAAGFAASGAASPARAYADEASSEEAGADGSADGTPVAVDYVTAGNPVKLAAAQVAYAWGTAESVVLVPSDGGALLLSAASLAGALHCPILYVSADPEQEVVDAVVSLQATHVYLVAAQSFDAAALAASLADCGFASEKAQLSDASVVSAAAAAANAAALAATEGATAPTRTLTLIQGNDASDTSTNLVRYGTRLRLWTSGQVCYASSTDLVGAQSCAPWVYQHAYAVLLTGADGMLSPGQRAWMSASGALSQVDGVTVLGSAGFVSRNVEAFSRLAGGSLGPTLFRRIEGDAATLVAALPVTYPAAEGVAVLVDTDQASWPMTRFFLMKVGGEVVDTAEDGVYDTAIDLLDDGVKRLVITMEGDPVDSVERARLVAVVDRINRKESSQVQFSGSNITYWDVGMKLSDMAAREVGKSVNLDGTASTLEQIEDYMDPTLTPIGEAGCCQFLNLSGGYTGLVTAEQLDAFIESYIPAIEKSTGYTSPFHGKGAVIIQAARESNINEVYILAHAIVECGAGCTRVSTLNGYYNFFGIAAYDSNPDAAGSFAESQGWKEADDAIRGGAAWISEHYINSSTYRQNTPYLMRWDLTSATHQFATSSLYPMKLGLMIERIYAFAGVDITDAGLSFSVPVFE